MSTLCNVHLQQLTSLHVAVVYCRTMRDDVVLEYIPTFMDTFDAEVVQEAVHANAHMVKDVPGGLMDPNSMLQ